jgi:protein TonB
MRISKMRIYSLTTTLITFAASATGLLTGCSSFGITSVGEKSGTASDALARIERVETLPDATSTARTVDAYKRDIAARITAVNPIKIYPGAPQALLRSIIVIKFSVDAGGQLLHSEIVRSNHDTVTEATALAALRNTAPFPKPGKHLLKNGKLEISETWLFNNDGRFQVRSVAQPQANQ